MNKTKISTIFLSACVGINAVAADSLEKTEQLQRQLYTEDVKTIVDNADDAFKTKKYAQAIELLTQAKSVVSKASKESPESLAQIKDLDSKLSVVVFAAVDQYILLSKKTSSSQDLEAAKVLLQKLIDTENQVDAATVKLEEVDELLASKSIEQRISRPELEQAQLDKLNKTEPLFEQAKLLFDNNRLEDCRSVIDQILIVNPYHLEATRLLKKTFAKLQEVGELRQQATRLDRLGEAEWEWIDPIKTIEIKNEATSTSEEDTPVPSEDESPLAVKLNSIVLPRVKFENATVEEVIEYLKKTSKRLDVDGTGVSFVYKKSSETEALEDTSDEEVLDDELDVDVDEDTESLDDTTVASTKDSLLTVELDNIPLGEFIRYFSSATGLRYQVDEFAVVIGKPDSFTNLLKTKFYPVSPDFVSDLDGEGAESSSGFGEDVDFEADVDAEAGSTAEKTSFSKLKSYFKELGVKFPKGATVSYILASSKLAVTNTDENLRQFETLIRELNVQPNQVNIESKFVEIGQKDAEQLGFNWFVGSTNTGPGSDFRFRPQTGVAGAVAGFNEAASNSASELTAGLGNILDASRAAAKYNPNLGIATVLGGTAFDVYIRAVDQTSSADVLSAPKVTTKSGQTATLRVVTERFFPESYQVAEVSTQNSSGSNIGTISFTPSKPEYADKPKDLGVVLEVTPTVNADGYTIKMDLRPTVLDLIGFDRTFNYTLEFNEAISQVNTTMPIFSRRSIETKVILWDGETLTIGGLNRERVESFDDGVPILKDIPFLGRLWESKGHESVKTNLLIFVTARLINPAGLPLRPNNIRGLPDYKRI